MSSVNFEPLSSAVSFADRRNAKAGGMIIFSFVGAVIIVVLGLIWGASINDFGTMIPMGVFAAFLLLFGIITYISKGREVRLARFAEANGFEYQVDVPHDGRPGMIFDDGRARKFDDLLSAKDGSFVDLGNYQYTIGSGRSRQQIHYAFMRIKLPRKLPNMVLDAKGNNFFGRFSNLNESFSGNQKLSLEGDFDKYFTLYAPEQYKTDALYVFTPDVMQVMIDAVSDYDCEVVDDYFYIYKNGKMNLTDPNNLKDLFSIADKLKDELHQQTDYYADSRVGDRSINEVAKEGKRLKQGWGWLIGIAIFIIINIVFRIISSFFDMG